MNKPHVLELAFHIEDPCGLQAVTLAQTVLLLLHDRDEVTIVALISEMRALALKYSRPSTLLAGEVVNQPTDHD